MVEFDSSFADEIREAVVDLPLYRDGPGVDYTNADVAYALNVTLIHDPLIRRDEQTGAYLPTSTAEALLVQRGRGDGQIGAFGGVSGYIDTVHDPTGQVPDVDFNPVDYTARTELSEECGLSGSALSGMEFHPGQRFSEPRKNGGEVHVIPVAGLCIQKPEVLPDGVEVTDYQWRRLNEIVRMDDLSPGYASHTLPSALGALGLSPEQVAGVLGVEHTEE